ncbi:MAG: hypothetical protein EP347_09810 [Alphaproteobacteria bacterium]|nr:MAG: hypothetical protein EP347_09810 [Alphaproteobacteria bacterium]
MTDRIKEMLDLVSQDYKAGKYISGGDAGKPPAKENSLKKSQMRASARPDFARAAQYAYPAPRDPQTWKRPTFEDRWQAASGGYESPIDPVDAAMTALHSVSCDGDSCELTASSLSERDRPRLKDAPLNKKQRQRFSMPEEAYDPNGKPKKKRRGFFGLFRRK